MSPDHQERAGRVGTTHEDEDGTVGPEEARRGSEALPMSPLGALLVRVAAFVYDSLLLVAVLFVVTAIALAFNDGEAFESPLYLLFALGIGWSFLDHFWRNGGQTLGMRAWRLKLVDDGDGSLTRGRTLARYALGCLLFGVTLLAIPFDDRRRAMHDRLTRTRVIRVPKV